VNDHGSAWKRRVLGACLAGLCLAAAEGRGEGRWITHLVTNLPDPAAVERPIDSIPCRETAGHWVWVVWYDLSADRWDYDQADPYAFSDGSVEWQVPAWDRWYFVLLYDTVTGIYY